LPTTPEDLARDKELRSWIVEAVEEYNERSPGSSTRIKRIGFLIEPPSIDGHEISDKGTVNQSVALQRRASDVERLYSEIPNDFVIILD
jgi:feruloyl-CoA synthase